MAQDDYELEVLLDLREQAQTDAEESYAGCVADLERAREFAGKMRAKLDQARQQTRQAKAERDQKLSAGGRLAELMAHDDWIDALRQAETQAAEALDRALKQVEAHRRQVDQAKQALIEATRQLEAVKKHREQWESEQARLAERRQSAAMDEIAARRWMERNE